MKIIDRGISSVKSNLRQDMTKILSTAPAMEKDKGTKKKKLTFVML